MSGHSKWATIKRAKGAKDAQRGQTFTKLANAVSLAARGGSDPSMNFQLRIAIDKAREANMPKDNIERAIKRGTGELGGARIEEVMYEAYGPGGTALLIQAATDNKNRASGDIKAILNKSGGKLAESGSVAYQFKHRGVITVALKDKNSDDIELAAIDAGAEDISEQGDIVLIYTAPKETEIVKNSLAEAGITPENITLSWEATMPVPVQDEKTAEQILKMVEKLEDLDDVTEVFSNFDISDEIMEKVA